MSSGFQGGVFQIFQIFDLFLLLHTFSKACKSLQLKLLVWKKKKKNCWSITYAPEFSVVASCTLSLHIHIHFYFLPLYIYLSLTASPPRRLIVAFFWSVFFRYFSLSVYFLFLLNLGFTFNLRMCLLSLTHLYLMWLLLY